MHYYFVPKLNGNYLSSNVDITTLENGVKVTGPLGGMHMFLVQKSNT